MDIKEAFAATLSRMEFNPTRLQLASQRYNAIKQVIEQALPGKTVTPIGSWQRQTKIRSLDLSDQLDIDLLVKVKTARWSLFGVPGVWQTPESALHQIQRVLGADQTYSMMRPKPDAPTVLLTYTDQCTFQIVPALVDKTGRYRHRPGEPDCYLVGVKRHSWSPADYDYEAAYLNSLNSQTGGRLVPCIKLIKGFLRGHGLSPDPLTSFHLEILCARIIPPIMVFWEAYGLSWGYQQVLAGSETFSALRV
jgi:Second Messenger Oligonucleotide or Dinucleotide Synthetase domain